MSERARVLVADDEASIRFVLRETLEAAGHEVVEVASGDAALQALSGAPFEIAFFDIRMPGPSGLELLDQVRATWQRRGGGDHHRAEHLRERGRGDEARRSTIWSSPSAWTPCRRW
jgi:CheY-like chemotaxis protein